MRCIIVFGGSGFIGTHLVKYLAGAGNRIKIFCRNSSNAAHLKVCGDPGQIAVVQGNALDERAVLQHLQGMDVAINLIGIINESGGSQKFHSIHVRAAELIAKNASNAGVKRLIHISALTGPIGSMCQYAHTKNLGEKRVLQEFPEAAIIRPGLVFGPGDNFFNKFAAISRISPVIPLVGGGTTLFQPVYVGDLAAFITKIVEKDLSKVCYDVAGPEVWSFKELIELLLKVKGQKKYLLSIPFWLSKVIAWFLENRLLLVASKILSGHFEPLLTVDQVEMLKADCTSDSRALESMGIKPHSVTDSLHSYILKQ